MVLDDLIQLIKSRKNGDANKSYTARLFNQGLEECCKKFGEESVELIIAALNKKDDNLKQDMYNKLSIYCKSLFDCACWIYSMNNINSRRQFI
jgi:phosphoribosyl-ATP pyrophosphohydrolase